MQEGVAVSRSLKTVECGGITSYETAARACPHRSLSGAKQGTGVERESCCHLLEDVAEDASVDALEGGAQGCFRDQKQHREPLHHDHATAPRRPSSAAARTWGRGLHAEDIASRRVAIASNGRQRQRPAVVSATNRSRCCNSPSTTTTNRRRATSWGCPRLDPRSSASSTRQSSRVEVGLTPCRSSEHVRSNARVARTTARHPPSRPSGARGTEGRNNARPRAKLLFAPHDEVAGQTAAPAGAVI